MGLGPRGPDQEGASGVRRWWLIICMSGLSFLETGCTTCREEGLTDTKAQHYLTHLLLPALLRSSPNPGADDNSNSRIAVVSSGAICRVTDASTLDQDLLAGSGKVGDTVYAETKFVQLLGAY